MGIFGLVVIFYWLPARPSAWLLQNPLVLWNTGWKTLMYVASVMSSVILVPIFTVITVYYFLLSLMFRFHESKELSSVCFRAAQYTHSRHIHCRDNTCQIEVLNGERWILHPSAQSGVGHVERPPTQPNMRSVEYHERTQWDVGLQKRILAYIDGHRTLIFASVCQRFEFVKQCCVSCHIWGWQGEVLR